jgi:hypothetical protein
MSKKDSTTISIRLKNVPYGAYILPMGIDENANLYMTYPAVEKILDYRERSLSEKLSAKKLKTLLGERLDCRKNAKIINASREGTPFVKVISFDLFLAIAQIEARTNDAVFQMMIDGFGDSLRSLAFDHFGLAIKTEERQEWLARRHKSKVARRTLTDAIKDYCIKHERSDVYTHFVYSNVSDCLNRGLFGKTAKKLCEERNCDRSVLRDYLTDSELREVEYIENLAMKLIDKHGAEPLEAMKQSLSTLVN